jgi:RNA polymerase sigma-70 factor (ECF subfamily)
MSGISSDNDRAELFLALLAKNQHRVSAFVHTLVANWHDGEEIVQDTLIVLWRKFEEFDAATDFFRWAAKVAQFEVLNYRRKSRHAQILDAEVLESLAATAIKLSDGTAQRRHALSQCLQRLSEQDRQILGLRYQDTGSVHGVATALGRSTSHVHRILRRIREQLLRCVRTSLTRPAN